LRSPPLTRTGSISRLGPQVSPTPLSGQGHGDDAGVRDRDGEPLYIGLANTLIFPATLGATLLGGLLADLIGFGATFLVSAASGLLTAGILQFLVADQGTLSRQRAHAERRAIGRARSGSVGRERKIHLRGGLNQTGNRVLVGRSMERPYEFEHQTA
jgi:hypothetical protein